MPHTPLEFIDDMKGSKHMALFHEEPEWARTIEFRFVRNGLQKGEQCTYLAHGNVKFVEDEMSDSGIDVEGYKQKNLLRVYDVPDMEAQEDLSMAFGKVLQSILADARPPCRFAGRLVPAVNTEKAMTVELEIERSTHADFGMVQGSVLCTYDIQQMPENEVGKWMGELFRCHHSVIFAPSFGKGLAFDMW